MKKILSLGAGVQSTAVLLMSCKGVLPKLDAAIFADTGWEPKAVYEHLEWLKAESERHDIPVYTVKSGDLRKAHLEAEMRKSNVTSGRCMIDIPLFTLSNGTTGMIQRQCTSEYKIKPVQKEMRRLLGYKKGQRIPVGSCELWMGISTDEIKRARVSQTRWIDFHYPLLLDKKMNRQNCKNWLEINYPERMVPRSACIGCPFHSNEEWLGLTKDEFADAVEFDKAIRNSGGERLESQLFLHKDCVPLDEAILSNDDQGDLFDNECMGMCGL